jgi:hypothetical protein
MGMAPEEINKNDASVTIVTRSQGRGNIFDGFVCARKAPTP